MADYPAIPFFTDSYLRDCGHLTDAEHGRYFLLLMLMWQTPNCRIPNEPEWIARRLKRSVEAYYSEVEPLIKEFCKSSGNWITQKRLSREYQFLKKTSKTQSVRAKSRWNKKKQPYRNDAASCAKQMPEGSPVDTAAMPPTHTLPTPKEDTSLRSVNGAKKATHRKHPLPDGWMPEPADNDIGYGLGFIEKDIEQEHAKFTDWAISANALKSNWNAAFRNWLRTAAERRASRVKV